MSHAGYVTGRVVGWVLVALLALGAFCRGFSRAFF